MKFLICLVHYPVSSSVFGVSVYTGRLLGDKYHPAHLTLHLLCVNQFFICTRIAQKYHPPTLLCVLPTFHFTRIICTPTLPTLLYISQKFIHSKHIPHKYHPTHLTVCKPTFHFTRMDTYREYIWKQSVAFLGQNLTTAHLTLHFTRFDTDRAYVGTG